jgi:hypothetical protein
MPTDWQSDSRGGLGPRSRAVEAHIPHEPGTRSQAAAGKLLKQLDIIELARTRETQESQWNGAVTPNPLSRVRDPLVVWPTCASAWPAQGTGRA